MTREELNNRMKEGAIILEPSFYDEAVIGITEDGRAIYSYEKIIEALMDHGGMSWEEAVEWTDYNTIRSLPYWGDNAPKIEYENDE